MKRSVYIALLIAPVASVIAAPPRVARAQAAQPPPLAPSGPLPPAPRPTNPWLAPPAPDAPSTPAAAAPGVATPDVEAAAEAPITGGDRVRARDRALDDAFRRAVEQSAAALLGLVEIARRASILKLVVLPRARSYVTGWRVLEEGEAAGVFRLRIVATLDLVGLERDLAPRAATGAAPADSRAAAPARVLLCLALRDGGAAAPMFTASPDEPRLSALVKAAGAEAAPLPGGCAPDDTNAALLDGRAAAAAKTAAARAALFGSVIVTPAGPIRGTALTSARADCELRLVEPDGRLAASIRESGYGWAPDAAAASAAAARDASSRAAAVLGAPLGELLARVPIAGVEVRLSGLNAFSDLQLFQRAAAAVPGVSSVEPRRFSASGAELLVRGEVSAQALATALSRGAFASRIAAARPGDRRLDVDLAPPPPPTLPPPPPPSGAAPIAPPPTTPGVPR